MAKQKPPITPPVADPHKVVLPPFRDHDAVLALFDDEDIWEWSSEWPDFDEELERPLDLSPAAFQRAIVRAEQGDAGDLIRLEKARLAKLRGGRPKMTKLERLRKFPIHRATSMVGLAETILRDLYPKQTVAQIHDRALFVVATIWNGSRRERARSEGYASVRPSSAASEEKMTVAALAIQIARSKKRRIT
jgi:hypothetical protein